MNGNRLTLAAVAALAGAGVARRGGPNKKLAYSTSLIGGDEEWDEAPFRVLHVSGEPSEHWQFAEISGEYEPAEDDDWVVSHLLSVLPEVADQFTEIKLRPPYVVLADLSDEDHLARFVDGTEAHPVVLIDPVWVHDVHPSEQIRFLIDSLLHEAGHAYLRSRGVEYDEDEEEVVEEYAQRRNARILDRYADQIYREEEGL